MPNSWWQVADIIPSKQSSDGWEVMVHGIPGLLIEAQNSWTLMLTVVPDSSLPQERWMLLSTLLLSANKGIDVGLCSFKQQFFLCQRYILSTEPNHEREIQQRIEEHISLTMLIGNWPQFFRKNEISVEAMALMGMKA